MTIKITKPITTFKELIIALTKEDTGDQQASIANMTEIITDLSDLIVRDPEIIRIIANNGLRRKAVKESGAN